MINTIVCKINGKGNTCIAECDLISVEDTSPVAKVADGSTVLIIPLEILFLLSL